MSTHPKVKLQKLAKRIETIDGFTNVTYSFETYTIELEFFSITSHSFREVAVYAHKQGVTFHAWFIVPVDKQKSLLHMSFNALG
jgi:hypothetical protein